MSLHGLWPFSCAPTTVVRRTRYDERPAQTVSLYQATEHGQGQRSKEISHSGSRPVYTTVLAAGLWTSGSTVVPEGLTDKLSSAATSLAHWASCVQQYCLPRGHFISFFQLLDVSKRGYHQMLWTVVWWKANVSICGGWFVNLCQTRLHFHIIHAKVRRRFRGQTVAL